jgi:signal transduction histidine kinase
MALESNSTRPVPKFIGSMRQQHWLSLMLLALHGSLVLELADPLAQALLISHFGLFLLWQPLWRGEQRLIPAQVLSILIGGSLLVIAQSWWLMVLWISVLFSLIGGNVPGIKNFGQRVVSVLAAVYLLTVLLAWVVPHLFSGQTFPLVLLLFVRYGLFLPIIAIFFIRVDPAQGPSHYSLDIFYSVLIFLMTVVLVLGAFAIKQLSHGNYVLALTQALFIFAIFLLTLSFLWDPRAGFAGIGQLVSRYFLSVGVPFERWMHTVAGLADRERDPDKFLILAAHELAELPWLSCVRWKAAGTSGEVGQQTTHATQFTFGNLTLTAFTRWSPGPALILHIRLLTRLLGDYYDAKVREQDQRRTAYLQAIYETGSRLTHDVKNLLQTLKSLCDVAATSGQQDAEDVRLLMQRQLPLIAQRLQITLDKLNSRPTSAAQTVEAKEWWNGFKQRFAHERVSFREERLPAQGSLQAELFETVAENFLQNALEKRKLNRTLEITVVLSWESGYVLSVQDNGTAVPGEIAQQLFQAPVSSQSGLGVGLYQGARFAGERGYEMRLAHNSPGNVTFCLAPSRAS